MKNDRGNLPLPVGEGWDEGAQLARDLEQTIAGLPSLPLGEDRGEGAQRVAEILEA